jgi:hypothetical protein
VSRNCGMRVHLSTPSRNRPLQKARAKVRASGRSVGCGVAAGTNRMPCSHQPLTSVMIRMIRQLNRVRHGFFPPRRPLRPRRTG